MVGGWGLHFTVWEICHVMGIVNSALVAESKGLVQHILVFPMSYTECSTLEIFTCMLCLIFVLIAVILVSSSE
jgi:hypothetical protein